VKRKRRDGDDGDGCCSLSGDVETLPGVCVCVWWMRSELCAEGRSVNCVQTVRACVWKGSMHVPYIMAYIYSILHAKDTPHDTTPVSTAQCISFLT